MNAFKNLFLQITGETVGEVKAVAGMHQRKAEMARHSDAFIALPGYCTTLRAVLHSIPFVSFRLLSFVVTILFAEYLSVPRGPSLIIAGSLR